MFLIMFFLMFISCAIVKIEKSDIINYSGEYKIANYYFEIGDYKKCLDQIKFILEKLNSHKDKLIADLERCRKMFGENEKYCIKEKMQIKDLEEWEKKINDLKKEAQEKVIK